MKSIITLTTDFGSQDGFVGQMKGVILSRNPCANIIDITHDIPPYSILEGALVLKGAVGRFTIPSIHVAVVDPGVGGKRKPLAVRLDDKFLVGPDNGLLSLILVDSQKYEARSIENPEFMAPKVSQTFHGRDIFAPAAAQLSLGRRFAEVGPVVGDIQTLEIPKVSRTSTSLLGEIIHVDRFGNLISNMDIKIIGDGKFCVGCGPIRIGELSTHYVQTGSVMPVALINSMDLLEIALPCGNASEHYRVGVGAEVRIIFE